MKQAISIGLTRKRLGRMDRVQGEVAEVRRH
jgi:hypothetical protein